MPSSSPVLSAAQRASFYWFDDGLPTLLTGVACLLMAFSLLYPHSGGSNLLSAVVALVSIVLYGLLLIRQREILDWLKSRITYPRTGYVSPPYSLKDANLPLGLTSLSLPGSETSHPDERDRSRQVSFMIAIALAVGLPIFFFSNPWLCLVSGFLTSAALWFGLRYIQRVSWILLAGFPLLGLAMLLFLPRYIDGPARVAWFLAGTGVILIVEGTVALLRYLEKNPLRRQTEK